MLKFRKTLAWLIVALMAGLGPAAITGCSSQKANKAGGGQTERQQPAESDDEFGEIEEEKTEKPLAIGEKGKNKAVDEIAVTKVTATKTLTSPEATKLLQMGQPGESPESDKSPAAGNEFIMVTLTFKGKDKKGNVITPSAVKLEGASGREVPETVTNGKGGLFNMFAAEAGQKASVTGVYEVPEGEEGLILTYQPFGDKEIKFEVR